MNPVGTPCFQTCSRRGMTRPVAAPPPSLRRYRLARLELCPTCDSISINESDCEAQNMSVSPNPRSEMKAHAGFGSPADASPTSARSRMSGVQRQPFADRSRIADDLVPAAMTCTTRIPRTHCVRSLSGVHDRRARLRQPRRRRASRDDLRHHQARRWPGCRQDGYLLR